MKYKILVTSFLLGFLLLTVLFFNYKPNNKERTEQPTIKKIDNIDENKKDLINSIAEDNQSSQIVEDSYQLGYNDGYRAFLIQMGTKEEDLPKVARYTTNTSSNDLVDVDEEEKSRGYADGYHKAADSIYCPRFNDPRYSSPKYEN